MSIFNRFANPFGSQFNTRFERGTNGQAAIGPNKFGPGKHRPQTMEEWQAYVDGLSRFERDQLYPGIHKDLIPATEMIDAMSNPAAPQSGFGTSQPSSYPGSTDTLPTGQKPGFGLSMPPTLSTPPNQFGVLSGDLPGQAQVDQAPGQKLPQTMAEWATLLDGMPRHERDQLWPGMHKDLIPATEIIEASVAGAGGTQVYANMPDRQDSENMAGGKDPRSIEHENPQCKYIRAEARELHRDVVRYRQQKQAIGRTIKKHKDEIASLSAYYGF